MSAVWEGLKRVFSGKTLWATGLAMAVLEVILTVVCLAYVELRVVCVREQEGDLTRRRPSAASHPVTFGLRTCPSSFWYGAHYGSNVNNFKLNGFPTPCTS